MRLNLQYTTIQSHSGHLAVSGIIDWSTIASFRAGLSRFRQSPHVEGQVDLTGLLSWSPQAQAALSGAIRSARLRGAHLAVVGLQPIPAWQARHSGLPGTEPLTGDHAAAWDADPDPGTAPADR